MKVMKTENKSSMTMALLTAIFGALVTAVLYFIIAKLGFFSTWAGAIGLTISISGYCFYTEKPDYMGLNTMYCSKYFWSNFRRNLIQSI